uniref:Uncharacterized protein n=1 Tax=Myoviridae sp. ct78050 TaxID=2826617 RepID=A0A8S5R0N4_9CAUD|nr:MAG TPA: hypothetical protein [Myoviridae sp. ct78050]
MQNKCLIHWSFIKKAFCVLNADRRITLVVGEK